MLITIIARTTCSITGIEILKGYYSSCRCQSQCCHHLFSLDFQRINVGNLPVQIQNSGKVEDVCVEGSKDTWTTSIYYYLCCRGERERVWNWKWDLIAYMQYKGEIERYAGRFCSILYNQVMILSLIYCFSHHTSQENSHKTHQFK